jgi:hypothetical protein
MYIGFILGEVVIPFFLHNFPKNLGWSDGEGKKCSLGGGGGGGCQNQAI